jgi:hypothetical protein
MVLVLSADRPVRRRELTNCAATLLSHCSAITAQIGSGQQ